MLEMIELQEIEGFWTLSKTITSLLAVNEESIKSVDECKASNLYFTAFEK